MAYSEQVLDHYENPRNVGALDKNADDVGTGMVGAPACFRGNTKIAVPSDTGYATLYDLWLRNQDLYVWSLNIATNQYELKSARCVKTGNKPTTIVTFDDGGVVSCTEDHQFLTASLQYITCKELTHICLKSFNKIIDNNGYWQINRQMREHVALMKTHLGITESLMWLHNIDHINENKRDNRFENLQLLSISEHNSKSKVHRSEQTVAERTESLCATIPYEVIYDMTIVDELPRWQIGDKLGITVEQVAEVQRWHGLTANPRRLLPEEQIIASRQRKLREKNPNFSGVSDDQLVKLGNELFIKHGKLTIKTWKDNAATYKVPTKVEHRFGKWSTFVDKAVNYNHKIVDLRSDGCQDVFCLQVEENNNFVVLTSMSLNRHSGIVVKNCGDVMKLQIKVEEGVIVDAKFKTYGCGSAIASSSLVTEMLKGKTLDEAQNIRNTNIAEALALPPIKIHCSILAEDAVKAAVADYRKKHGEQQ